MPLQLMDFLHQFLVFEKADFTKENIELQKKILIFAPSRKEAIITLEILIFSTIFFIISTRSQ